MRRRVFFLLVILIFRFILGWLESTKYSQNAVIKVTGNIYKIDHNDTKCVIRIGDIFVDPRKGCFFSQGDKVEIIGRVRRGVIDNILGRIWLDSAEIVVFDKEEDMPDEPGVIEAVLIKFREKMLSRYRMHLPEPESSLVAGIILGYKKDIGREFYDKMIKSGTIHIAVASGYNIMLVGGTTLSICLWFLKRKKATIVSIFLMAVYALEAGGEPPVVRAVIMGIVVFLAACIGRKVISWWILLVTGWLMVIIEPLLLLDVSFQLSMAASVGLMIVEPCLRKKIENWDRRLSELVSGSGILSSVSTMAMTVPIIWYQFGRMSLIGILSNTLILPFVPLLMILGAGMQILPRLFFWPTYIMAHWIVGVIEFFGM